MSDSLVEFRKRRESRVQQELLAIAAGDATRLPNMRYTGGVSPYLEVLDSERQLFDAELRLVRRPSATSCSPSSGSTRRWAADGRNEQRGLIGRG